MKVRLLATLAAAVMTAAALGWAAGLFSSPSAPEGAIASDTIQISVGTSSSLAGVLEEITSLSGPGIAVLAAFALLLVCLGALVAEVRSTRSSEPQSDEIPQTR